MNVRGGDSGGGGWGCEEGGGDLGSFDGRNSGKFRGGVFTRGGVRGGYDREGGKDLGVWGVSAGEVGETPG